MLVAMQARCGLVVRALHHALSQKVLLVPAAPSSLNASLSLGAVGIMVGRPLLALYPRICTSASN